MTEKISTHTLNARGHVLLEVTRDHLDLSPEPMFREINAMRDEVVRLLAAKGIKCEALRGALAPDRIRREIALVFDTTAIESGAYGHEVFKRVIPLLDKTSSHSILVGDYLDRPGNADLVFEAFQQVVRLVRKITFRHPTQFYIVYINNLTDEMVGKLTNGLRAFEGYVGFADMTFSSPFKILLSTMLVNLGIKHKGIMLQGHEPDRPADENINMSGYPFEQNDYVCRSISTDLMGVLLSYKIERPVFEGFETDTEFALNTISPTPLPLKDFEIEVAEAKLAYIKSQKGGSIEKAALQEITATELSALILGKLSASYLYDLAMKPDYNVAQFNVMLELGRGDGRARLLAGLAYEPKNKKLRLLTFF